MHYFPIFSKNNREIDRPLARWHVGTFIDTLARLLTRWQVKMRSRHVFGTMARGQVGK